MAVHGGEGAFSGAFAGSVQDGCGDGRKAPFKGLSNGCRGPFNGSRSGPGWGRRPTAGKNGRVTIRVTIRVTLLRHRHPPNGGFNDIKTAVFAPKMGVKTPFNAGGFLG